MNKQDLFVSVRDAEALALMLDAHRRRQALASDASEELEDLLLEARRVPAELLPADRVALNSTVSYVEDPAGVRRSVTLVLPAEAAASSGKISVLSPIGLALMGRRRGDVVNASLPGRRSLEIHILECKRNGT